jgi:hypothetical protein
MGAFRAPIHFLKNIQKLASSTATTSTHVEQEAISMASTGKIPKRKVGRSTQHQTSTSSNGVASTNDGSDLVEEVADIEEIEAEYREPDDSPDDEGDEDEDGQPETIEEVQDIERPWLEDSKCPKSDCHILGPDEPIKVTGVMTGGTVTLDKSVFRAFQIPRAKGWYFKLVHAKGARVGINMVNHVAGRPFTTAPSPVRTFRADEIQLPPDTFTLPRSA